MSENLTDSTFEYRGWLFWLTRNFIPNLTIKNLGIISRFSDVQEALSRPDVFQVTYAPMMDPSVGPFMLGRDCSVFNRRDKGVMHAFLNQESLPYMRQEIKRILDGIIDANKDAKHINIVPQITRECPALFTQQCIGFQNATIEQIKRWSFCTQLDMFHNLENNEDVHRANIQAGEEMRAHLKELMVAKKNELSQGKQPVTVFEKLISMQLPESVGFDENRVLTNTMGLLVGGIETTSQAAAQIVNQLFNRPTIFKEAVDAALNDNEKFKQYCWEALRFDPINPGVFRLCKKDYTIARGTLRRKTFKAGTRIFIVTRSAMFDKEQLRSPGKFMTDRPEHVYMHFGYGLHTCLGDQISKIQIPEIVKAIVTLPGVRRVSDMEKEDGGFPSKLNIEFN